MSFGKVQILVIISRGARWIGPWRWLQKSSYLTYFTATLANLGKSALIKVPLGSARWGARVFCRNRGKPSAELELVGGCWAIFDVGLGMMGTRQSLLWPQHFYCSAVRWQNEIFLCWPLQIRIYPHRGLCYTFLRCCRLPGKGMGFAWSHLTDFRGKCWEGLPQQQELSR